MQTESFHFLRNPTSCSPDQDLTLSLHTTLAWVSYVIDSAPSLPSTPCEPRPRRCYLHVRWRAGVRCKIEQPCLGYACPLPDADRRPMSTDLCASQVCCVLIGKILFLYTCLIWGM